MQKKYPWKRKIAQKIQFDIGYWNLLEVQWRSFRFPLKITWKKRWKLTFDHLRII